MQGRRLLTALPRRTTPAGVGLILIGAGVVAGLLITRPTTARLSDTAVQMIQAALGTAAAVATLRRALTGGPQPAGCDVHVGRQLRNWLRRMA
jgi:hypothetical protein